MERLGFAKWLEIFERFRDLKKDEKHCSKALKSEFKSSVDTLSTPLEAQVLIDWPLHYVAFIEPWTSPFPDLTTLISIGSCSNAILLDERSNRMNVAHLAITGEYCTLRVNFINIFTSTGCLKLWFKLYLANFFDL